MFYMVVQIDKLHDINGIVPPLCNIRPPEGHSDKPVRQDTYHVTESKGDGKWTSVF